MFTFISNPNTDLLMGSRPQFRVIRNGQGMQIHLFIIFWFNNNIDKVKSLQISYSSITSTLKMLESLNKKVEIL